MSKTTLSFKLAPVIGALCLTSLASLACLTACDPGEGETNERSTQLEFSAPAPVAASDTADKAPAQANPAAAIDGTLREQIMALQPQKTRAGWLRITDPVIHTPDAMPLLVERLQTGADAPEVRAALAEAISRTGADYAGTVATMLLQDSAETDARVREVLVGTLGHHLGAPAQHDALKALKALSAGLTDEDVSVRSAAARVLADRHDGAALAEQLITALADLDPTVRADAARSLGVLKVDAALPALADSLTDADPDVRLRSLRALDRIDPAFAGSVAPLPQLGQDADPRVARLATAIAQR